ncbi:rhodanese-like domain-containing protein [Leptolyngbya sp. 'hensonii']|uniref:rhodanese-like domain-containing protein n=1 Tax=Leptolyngbya sp. 'hensonii' TaxID=1922337 RepID=UPI0015C5799E|nr:rhodanese-like domain-containing protein [Leptolyngbya sp. 'hensonii']
MTSGRKLAIQEIPDLTAGALMQLMAQQPEAVLLIDVRYLDEYRVAHLPNANQVGFPALQKGNGIGQIKEFFDQQQRQCSQTPCQIVVYCTAGVRSARAVSLLRQAGLPAINLRGGLRAWESRYAPAKGIQVLAPAVLPAL